MNRRHTTIPYLGILFLFVFLNIGCRKGDLKVDVDDRIGIIPQISPVNEFMVPYQIVKYRNDWIFCQEGDSNFIRLNKDFEVQAISRLNGNSSWISKNHFVETQSGRFYHFFYAGLAGLFMLEELDENGKSFNLQQVGVAGTSAYVVGIYNFQNDDLILSVAERVLGNNRTLLLQFSPSSSQLDTLFEMPGYAHSFDLVRNENLGYWWAVNWRSSPGVQSPAGSIIYFDSAFNFRRELLYEGIDGGIYFNNRTGLVVPRNGSTVDVFVPFDISTSSGQVEGLTHIAADTNGNRLATVVYGETLYQETVDVSLHNDRVVVLTKETGGIQNPTGNLLIHELSKDGTIVYSKYLRNTEHLKGFAAVLKYHNQSGVILATDKDGVGLVKVEF